MAVINGTDAPETINGTEEDDTINGGGTPASNNLNPDDTIYGLGGNDTIEGGHGNDTVYGGEGNDVITANVGGSDDIYGEGGNDHIVVMQRGTPPPTIDGGEGDDWIEVYIAQPTILGGAGNDTIYYSGSTFGLVAGTIDAGSGDDHVIFVAGGNRQTMITLGAGKDVLEMRKGGVTVPDFIPGDDGDRLDFSFYGAQPFTDGTLELRQVGADTQVIEVSTGNAQITLKNVQMTSLTAYNFSGDGGGIPVNLDGDEGPNTLNGGTNADVLRGFGGDDQLYGKGGNDRLEGGNDNDILDGGAGADQLIGGSGNDFYYVDNVGDTIEEAAGGGYDNVLASVNYKLNAGAYVEILSTTNHSGTEALRLTGNELAQVVIGNAGSNLLDGGLNGGADTLQGLGGDDFLHVDADDIVIEAAGGGYDNVLARESYVLTAGAAVEILSTNNHQGTAAINLTGNELGQLVIGNAGSNKLIGGGGADTLQGLEGNDFLVVDSDDLVLEAAGGGYDNVQALGNYALNSGAMIEVLSTTDHGGTAGVTLIGNEQGQIIIGNAGSNSLLGGGGADTLQGLGGNDFLYVDANDAVLEAAGGGYDNVLASASFVLNAGAAVEVLSTTSHGGTAAIDLTGNELSQAVIGNAGANVLNGGGGADTLLGLGGADSFAFTTALGSGNVDNLADFSAVDDTILIDNAVFAGLADGALPASAFVTGAAAGDADDRIIYNSTTGQIFFDADGNGAGASILFASVAAGTILTASDFTVI